MKEKNIKLAVCTNKMEKLSNLLLDKLGVLNLFDFLAGGDSFPYQQDVMTPMTPISASPDDGEE